MYRSDPYWTISHKKTETERFQELDSWAKYLYLWMRKWDNKLGRNNDGWFCRSLKDLAKDMGISVNTVRKARDELIERGFLNEDNGKKERRKSWYKIDP